MAFFFFNDTATTEIYTLSLHDALPICCAGASWTRVSPQALRPERCRRAWWKRARDLRRVAKAFSPNDLDRKSTRLNSSHANISYAVFCLKKQKLLAIFISTIHSLTLPS